MRPWALSASALLFSLAGCGAAPTQGVYLLGDPPSAAAGVWPQSGRPILQILPVSVPDYLDTRDILIRNGPNEVKARPTGRWGERLSVGITTALTTALIGRLPRINIVASTPIATPAQQLLVDVEAFEIEQDGRCLLTANWTLSSGDGRRVVHSERGTFIEKAADAGNPAIAAAMTRAIDRLADQIAMNKDGR